MSTELDEYLEKVVEAAFKREFEQDENVVRSLPFFAAALGLAVAIFTAIVPRIATLSPLSSLLLALFLVLAAAFFLAVLWCLFQIVREREFKIPPNEQSFVQWAQDLEQFYRIPGRSAAKATALARDEARRVMIQSYAEAAVDNRASNRKKFGYRALGFTLLVILIALASLSVGVIFIDKQWSRLSAQGARDAETHDVVTEGREERRQREVRIGGAIEAQAAPNQGRVTGSEVPLGAGGQRLGDDRKITPAGTPAAAAAPASNGIRQEERPPAG
jgi:hypothetical protein